MPSVDELIAKAKARGLMEDPESARSVEMAIRMRYFEKFVKPSRQYQEAVDNPKRRTEMEEAILGFGTARVPENSSIPPTITKGTPPPHRPLPVPTAPQPMESAASQTMGVLGNIGSRLGQAALGSMEPGGVLSPESMGTAGGGLMGARMGAPLGPLGALGGGLIGAGVGAMAGRGSEMGAESTLGELGQASQRGIAAGAFDAAGSGVAQRIGQRLLRPMGPLSQGASQTMRELDELGLPMRAGSIRESRGLAHAEEVPQGFIFGGSKGAAFDKAKANRQREIVMDMADKWSPGLKKDWQDVGKALGDKSEAVKRRHLDAASDLYERSKDLVGREGRFAITNLEAAADEVVAAEAPMQSMANSALGTAKPFSSLNPIRQVLADAGFEPGRVYSYEDLLKMNQRLGAAVRRAGGDRALKRELSMLWASAQEDLAEAAETAGVPEAIELVKRGNEYYRTFIVPTFDDSTVLKAIARDPVRGAKLIASPKTSVVEMRKAHRATAGKAWDDLRGKWYEGMLDKATVNGEFDSARFVRQVRQYDGEQLDVLAGAGRKDLEKLVRLLERENRSSSTTNRASLSMGQLIGYITAGSTIAGAGLYGGPLAGVGTALAVSSAPVVLGKILNSPNGIKWLTTGLQAPRTRAGAMAITKLATEFGSLGATRPGAMGQLGFPPLPTPSATPVPAPSPEAARSPTPRPGL